MSPLRLLIVGIADRGAADLALLILVGRAEALPLGPDCGDSGPVFTSTER
jgi:hypothetical protein